MKFFSRLSAAALVTFASAASAGPPQQSVPFPERWHEAGVDFGSLVVAYRLTDDCDIDPDFEITKSPEFDVTRGEIYTSLTSFLAMGTSDDIPRDIVIEVVEEVTGQEEIPDREITLDEFNALTAALERRGPWPQVRLAPVGGETYRCTFDIAGSLIRVEQSVAGEDAFSDFTGELSEQGPFIVRWTIEE